MSSAREQGLALLREMIPDLPSDDSGQLPRSDAFATGLGELSLDNVFGSVWIRPGLDRRSRSLVTLGILIALRAEDELKVHFQIALRNAVTREELEEVVYHASAYTGFPAAATAQRIGHEVLDK
ncbi:carboxymuconolactone decarboxylase family protein [Nocardia sp. CA2R105]|uniref:carboxymuconolactone decarboxylase family protein n=1 Tax=Nocardia coffeae TaxID=2873381 RepID=UPI001CA6AA7A|nr:carboxymuconolactone decarboxylase family protein [Nocardia coffeae]MBY8862316.1 carboxymuconolactone decarboxylase family protein [Nocardia coffeae]